MECGVGLCGHCQMGPSSSAGTARSSRSPSSATPSAGRASDGLDRQPPPAAHGPASASSSSPRATAASSRSSTSRTSCSRSPSGSTSSSSPRPPRAAPPAPSTSCSSRARSAPPEHLEQIARLRRAGPRPRHDRRLRHRRRHPGPAQLGRPRRVPRRGLPAARSASSRWPWPRPVADYVDGRRASCAAAPSTPAQLRRAPHRARHRPPAAAAATRPSASSASGAASSASSSPGASPAWARSPGPAAAPSARAYGRGCYGCFGPREQANAAGARGRSLAMPVGRRREESAACSPASPPGRSRSAAMIDGRTADRPAPRVGAEREPRGMHDTRHCRPASSGDLVVDIAGLTRVEGEGSLRLRVRDGEVERGAPRDLRGAALLRAARRGPDARRGHRHRRPHLRHLPGRLPDERGPRLRARSSGSRSTRRSARCAACSTAASGSRATPSTSTCSTLPDFLGYASAHRAGPRPPAAGRAGPDA